MRLATFNVLHGRAPADDLVDLDRFAAAVRALDADVLALQEVDRGQPRSHGADLTAIAGEAMGAASATFGAALSGLPGDWRRAEDSDGPGTPQYGVALLTRYPVEDVRVLRLPALPGRVAVLFPGRRRPELVGDEPRVALIARLRTPLGPLTVAATHLSFIPWWNLVQLRRLVAATGRAQPLVVTGDLNMPPGRARTVTGLQTLAVADTYPGDAPREQLDHLLGRGLTTVAGTGRAVALALSDHRALTVEVATRD